MRSLVKKAHSAVKFGVAFATNIKKVGALNQTSEAAAIRIAGHLRPFDNVVVEFGPGLGAVTKKLLAKLPPSGKLIAVEFYSDFIPELQKIAEKDPRLMVIEGDATAVCASLARHSPSAVFASIPFSSLQEDKREQLVADISSILPRGGMFFLFQYRRHMETRLHRHFSAVTGFKIPENTPTYYAMAATK